MNKQLQYIQAIHNVYPDLKIEKAQLNQNGQFNDILLVNNKTIFRFPKTLREATKLVTEIRLLRSLKGFVTLPIHMESNFLNALLTSTLESKPSFHGHGFMQEPLPYRKLFMGLKMETQQRLRMGSQNIDNGLFHHVNHSTMFACIAKINHDYGNSC